jgi:hypothetical protein
MSKELREVHSRISRLRKILHQAIKAHAVLAGISEFAGIRTAWDYETRPPHEHKMMLNAYDDFFGTAQESLLLDAHIQLSKLLVDNPDALYIRKLIRYVRSEEKKIKKAQQSPDFLRSIEDFGIWYYELNAEDLGRIAAHLEDHEHLIIKLALVRNKRLGHENLKEVQANMLTLDELGSLIEVSEAILEIIEFSYGGHDRERYRLEGVKRDTIFMLEKLYTTY